MTKKFDVANPPEYILRTALNIADELFEETGEALRAEHIVYGLPGATYGELSRSLASPEDQPEKNPGKLIAALRPPKRYSALCDLEHRVLPQVAHARRPQCLAMLARRRQFWVMVA